MVSKHAFDNIDDMMRLVTSLNFEIKSHLGREYLTTGVDTSGKNMPSSLSKGGVQTK
jgi:hypothetical protein